jgi:hypothetical protein
MTNICFPSKGVNPSFPAVKLHEVSSAPAFYMFNIRLQQNALLSGIYGMKDFDVISK